MPRSYRLPIIAIAGWLGLCLSVDAQHQTSPTLESKPVTATQSPERPSDHQDGGAKEQSKPEALAPALEKIESAIRDAIPPKDEAKDQRQENRDVSDLKAQKDMARWAERMFWATGASIALTLIGILLIWRTLHHTRRAAVICHRSFIQ